MPAALAGSFSAVETSDGDDRRYGIIVTSDDHSICSMENTQGNKKQDESIGPLLSRA
jgi:hypothetical protein